MKTRVNLIHNQQARFSEKQTCEHKKNAAKPVSQSIHRNKPRQANISKDNCLVPLKSRNQFSNSLINGFERPNESLFLLCFAKVRKCTGCLLCARRTPRVNIKAPKT